MDAAPGREGTLGSVVLCPEYPRRFPFLLPRLLFLPPAEGLQLACGADIWSVLSSGHGHM